MDRFALILILVGLFQGEVKAEALIWNVSPSTCVVHESGDFCRLGIEVKISNHRTQSSCLYFNNEQLNCWSETPHQFTWELVINKPGMLTLKGPKNHILLKKKLEIKSIKPVKKRRRVRSPWSMF